MADNIDIADHNQGQPVQVQQEPVPIGVVLPAHAIMPIPLVINIPGAMPIPVVIQVPLDLQVPAMMPAPINIQIQDFVFPPDQVQEQQHADVPAAENEDEEEVEVVKYVHVGRDLFKPKILPEDNNDDSQPPSGPKSSMGMAPKS